MRLHEFIEAVNGSKQQWASGVILSREGARALICTEPQDRQVMVTVTGPVKARQQLASLCQAEMRGIHAEIRGLDPGEKSQVQGAWVGRELSEADVVIILASSAALATNYITQHEIPRALELHNSDKTVVVPVILEACRWSKTALAVLNALPEIGKALNKWKPPSDGWNSVADGLAKVFEKLMEKGGARKRQGAAFSLKLK